MTVGFLASFGSLFVFFALLHVGAYIVTRSPRQGSHAQPEIRDRLARAEAHAKEIEFELAAIRNAIAS